MNPGPAAWPVPLEPVTLAGPFATLVPLAEEHAPVLLAAGRDERVWTYMRDRATTPEAMAAYVGSALADWRAGSALPFVVIDPDGRVVGSTRFMAADRANRGLEIGSTWYSPDVWRTAVNTQCKFLLLEHAFSRLGCIRVELKTDARNLASRAAIARLGALEEGTLRSKVIMRDGYRRDSVYFSILDREWPGVRARLLGFLGLDAS
ncbi:MAG TPA: GNAT family protein [Deinococcales bacterium]|nr:GNAT family protein [Deinococcales bacterium]